MLQSCFLGKYFKICEVTIWWIWRRPNGVVFDGKSFEFSGKKRFLLCTLLRFHFANIWALNYWQGFLGHDLEMSTNPINYEYMEGWSPQRGRRRADTDGARLEHLKSGALALSNYTGWQGFTSWEAPCDVVLLYTLNQSLTAVLVLPLSVLLRTV